MSPVQTYSQVSPDFFNIMFHQLFKCGTANYSFQTWPSTFVLCSSKYILIVHLLCFRHSLMASSSSQSLSQKPRGHSRHVLLSYPIHPKIQRSVLPSKHFLNVLFLSTFTHLLLTWIIITTAQCSLPMCSLIFLKPTLLPEQSFKTTNLLMLLSHLKPFSNSQLPLGYNPNSWALHRNAYTLLPFQSWALSSVQHFLHFTTGTLPSYPTFYLATSFYSSYRFQLRSHLFQGLFPEHPRLGALFFCLWGTVDWPHS